MGPWPRCSRVQRAQGWKGKALHTFDRRQSPYWGPLDWPVACPQTDGWLLEHFFTLQTSCNNECALLSLVVMHAHACVRYLISKFAYGGKMIQSTIAGRHIWIPASASVIFSIFWIVLLNRATCLTYTPVSANSQKYCFLYRINIRLLCCCIHFVCPKSLFSLWSFNLLSYLHLNKLEVMQVKTQN